MLEDGPHRARLRDAGLDRAREFSWRRTAEETARVYRELTRHGALVTPRISVIVLTYNGRAWLEPCLVGADGAVRRAAVRDSARRQRLDRRIDRPVADRFPSVRIVDNGRNLGFAGGNNAGARVARGEIARVPQQRHDCVAGLAGSSSRRADRGARIGRSSPRGSSFSIVRTSSTAPATATCARAAHSSTVTARDAAGLRHRARSLAPAAPLRDSTATVRTTWRASTTTSSWSMRTSTSRTARGWPGSLLVCSRCRRPPRGQRNARRDERGRRVPRPAESGVDVASRTRRRLSCCERSGARGLLDGRRRPLRRQRAAGPALKARSPRSSAAAPSGKRRAVQRDAPADPRPRASFRKPLDSR